MVKYMKGEEIKTFEDFNNLEKVFVIEYDEFGEELRKKLYDIEDITLTFIGSLNENTKIFKAIKLESYYFSNEKDNKIKNLIIEYFDINDNNKIDNFIKQIKDILQ